MLLRTTAREGDSIISRYYKVTFSIAASSAKA
jgi:hypothetical protein